MDSGTHSAYLMLRNHRTRCTCSRTHEKKNNGNPLRLQAVAAAAWLSAEQLVRPRRAAPRLHRHPGLIICLLSHRSVMAFRVTACEQTGLNDACAPVLGNKGSATDGAAPLPSIGPQTTTRAPCRGEVQMLQFIKDVCTCDSFLFFSFFCNLLLTYPRLCTSILSDSNLNCF